MRLSRPAPTHPPAPRTPGQSLSPWLVFTVISVALALIFVVTPIANVILRSVATGGGLDGWREFVTEGKYFRALRNSLLLSALVSAISTVIGVFLAYFNTRYRFWGKSVLGTLPIAVLLIPELIISQSWLMLLGNNGVVSNWLRDVGIGFPSMYGWAGLLLVMPLFSFPYVYLGTLAAFKGFDSQLEEAAVSLGSTPFRARVRVTIPAILPAVLSTTILVFSLTLGNFTTATVVGKRVELLAPMTYRVFLAETGADPKMQSTLATVSVAIIALTLLGQNLLIGGRRYHMVQGRSWTPIPLRGPHGFALTSIATIIVAATLLPFGLTAVMAFTKSTGPVLHWGEFSVDNFASIMVSDPYPIRNTLVFGGVACIIGVILSAVVSTVIVRKKNLLSPLLSYLVMFPQALSGTVLGIGVVMSFGGRPWNMSGTALIIILVFVVRRLPHGVRSASGSIHSIPESIEEASVSLGVPPLRSFARVVLPLMLPGIAAAAILTWVTIIGELSASLVVYSAGQETINIRIFQLMFAGMNGQAAAYGLVLCVLALAPILVATRVLKVRLFT
ncbi:ABC transporter permease [Xylanimonas ulmi]|uniref:Iron(III) transport system permease protein n=1 Tax=Xylanimonas ulmi TaxID=228973 RepID=A0A4Q7LZJ2_9MICO|nr:iron ABC transporter permease [Xylanibacterium ulmi]RZS59827.1 iron(III) transport system permease protein [Xylanibacterium ulmi]